MANGIQSITLELLVSHPDNPNRMSKVNFGKLVCNIEQTGRYEPIIVRPCPQRKGSFQIINGYHRRCALAKLGYKTADCVVWDIDDEQTDVLLATLNRLGGSDELGKKLTLLKRLNKRIKAGELAKLLPQTAKQIERLTNLKMPSMPAKINPNCFANPLVFFLNDTQQQIVEQALSLAKELGQDLQDKTQFEQKKEILLIPSKQRTKAAKRAAALVHIAGYFLSATGGQEPFKI